MNDHTYRVLGLHELLGQIADYAQSRLGQSIILGIRPKTDLHAITAEHPLYQDMLGIQESSQSLPTLRVEDVEPLLRQLAPEGSIADGKELLLCMDILNASADLAAFLQKDENLHWTALQNACHALAPCPALRADLKRCLDNDGNVQDNASPTLRDLRRNCYQTEQRIRKTLEQMVKTQTNGLQQDSFVTLRNGRYVVPVKKDARGQVSGIVHDVSQSGQTVFVEPAATLPMGNELVRLRAEERDEVRRILARLSTDVRAHSDALRGNQRLLARLDAAHAIARWACAYGGNLPKFGKFLTLATARHPLLLAQFRKNGQGQNVVPLDFQLPKGKCVLAITGSNTGGKTIALKTIGLCCLMAQCGLPVPASPDSQFCIFDHILADIGDEQSIEANLSTYSGHIANIAKILSTAQSGHSLVLLDELGSGTDPLEGGAIACGVLDALIVTRSLTIATTHLGMVKNYVHQHPAMINGSVRFDLETLAPQYILDIGRPGASHALHIAQRLGLPKRVLDKANQMLSGEQLKLEDMLAKIEKDQKILDEQTRQAEAKNAELTQKRDELTQELASLKAERKRHINNAYTEANAIVDNTRREMENLIRSIREQQQDGTTTAVNAAQQRAELEEKQRKLLRGQQITAAKNAPALQSHDLKTGKKVWVEKLKSHGRISHIDDNGKNVQIDINGMIFTMRASELQQATDTSQDDLPKQVIKVLTPKTTHQNTPSEINLIGLRVEEALERLEQFISQSIVARLDEVRIVHGFGTGRLREGIHNYLRSHHGIANYRLGQDFKDPGGGGCTIVTLRR